MHILQIETVAVSTPGLIEDLCPFLLVINRYTHIRQINRILQVYLSFRHIHHIKTLLTIGEDRLLIGRIDQHHRLANGCFLLLLQVKEFRPSLIIIIDPLTIRIKIEIVGTGQRQMHDTIAYTLDIHLHRRRRVALLSLIRLSLVHTFSVLVQERRWRILREKGQIDATHIIINVVPLQLAIRRVEVAIRAEDQIFPVGTECGRAGVVPFISDSMLSLAGDIIQVDDRIIVLRYSRIGQPIVIRREADIPGLAQRALRKLAHLLGRYVEQVDPVLAIGINDPLRVGTPSNVTDISIVVLGRLYRIATFSRLQINLCLTRRVGDISDPFPIGAPDSITIMSTR